MSRRPDLDVVATAAALLVCAAFIASFALGLRGRAPAPDVTDNAAIDEPPLVAAGKVEVLNASGVAGLARAGTDRLRTAGFDVVYFGNAPASAGDSSLVIDRTGNDAVARAVARSLGILRVETRKDTTLFLDATVLIGKDWKN